MLKKLPLSTFLASPKVFATVPNNINTRYYWLTDKFIPTINIEDALINKHLLLQVNNKPALYWFPLKQKIQLLVCGSQLRFWPLRVVGL